MGLHQKLGMSSHISMRKIEIRNALGRLRISPGETVLVHSSMKALGPVEGGAKVVVRQFLDFLGPEGTLVVPTFLEDFFWGDENQIWDRERSPSAMGIFSEMVRIWPGALRTAHAPHPLSAIGPNARKLAACTNNRDFDEDSPFQLLVDLDSWIVLLGVDFNVCTMLHLIEERLQVPYRNWGNLKGIVIDGDKRERKTYEFYRRESGVENDFLSCGQDMDTEGLVREARLGKGMVKAIRAKHLLAFVSYRVAKDPYYLLTPASRRKPPPPKSL